MRTKINIVTRGLNFVSKNLQRLRNELAESESRSLKLENDIHDIAEKIVSLEAELSGLDGKILRVEAELSQHIDL